MLLPFQGGPRWCVAHRHQRCRRRWCRPQTRAWLWRSQLPQEQGRCILQWGPCTRSQAWTPAFHIPRAQSIKTTIKTGPIARKWFWIPRSTRKIALLFFFAKPDSFPFPPTRTLVPNSRISRTISIRMATTGGRSCDHLPQGPACRASPWAFCPLPSTDLRTARVESWVGGAGDWWAIALTVWPSALSDLLNVTLLEFWSVRSTINCSE